MAKKPYTTDCRQCGNSFTYQRKYQTSGRFEGRWHGSARHTCSQVCKLEKSEMAKIKRLNKQEKLNQISAAVPMRVRRKSGKGKPELVKIIFELLGVPMQP